MSATRATEAIAARRSRPHVAAAAWLVLAALLLWGLEVAAGHLITTSLRGTAFIRWDAAVDRTFASSRSDTWNTLTHVVTAAAETYPVIGIGVVFFVGMRLRLGRWRESVFLAVALAGEVTIFVCTTLVIDRPRPPVAHLDSAPPTSSFPSGHTAAAVALYGALAIVALTASTRRWLRWLAVVAAMAMPVAVGLSRLYRGMHYPSDVAAGAILGLLWLLIAGLVVLRRSDASRGVARA